MRIRGRADIQDMRTFDCAAELKLGVIGGYRLFGVGKCDKNDIGSVAWCTAAIPRRFAEDGSSAKADLRSAGERVGGAD